MTIQHRGNNLARPTTSRRAFLRGAGVCLALPTLESLAAQGLRGSEPPQAPLRMAFVYVPNGVHQRNWWPKTQGKDFELTPTLQPLAPVKNWVQVLGGLDHKNATAGPDGAGDHARAGGTFLTGVRVRKTAGADIHAGISVDQIAAAHLGHATRFPSLELSCDSVHKSGNCDSGYSCAYQYNLSWRSPTLPLTPEPNPRLLFERLYGAGPHGARAASLAERQRRQRSILDFVADQARSLTRSLGPHDRSKLDEYLTSLRDVESRITQAENPHASPGPNVETPPGIPSGFQDYIQLMFDMLLLAFQTDTTRIATFLVAGEGSNRTFPEIGIAEGHHNLSHHMGNRDMMDKIAQIDHFYLKQFARFLEKAQAIQDADGQPLLANTMIVYGSGNADGNAHTHHNLPVILAGGGGGSLTPGRFVKFSSQPMTNLYLSMLDRMGVPHTPRLGDSTGRLAGI